MRNRKPLRTALEDGDLGLDLVPEATPASVEPVDAQVAQTMGDSAEQAIEVQEEVAAVESLSFSIEEALDTVEEAEDAIETTAEVAGDEVTEAADGTTEIVPQDDAEGLDEGEAAIAEEHFRSISRRLGFDDSVLPSMEDFKSVSRRVSSYRVGMETLRERAAQIVKDVLAALEALWKKITDFVKGIFSANAANDNAIRAMTEKLKTTKFEGTPSDLTGSAYLKVFVSDSENIDKSVVEKYLADHIVMSRNFFGSLPAAAESIASASKKISSDEQGELSNAAIQAANSLATVVLGKKRSSTTDEKKLELVSDLTLIGGKQTKFIYEETENGLNIGYDYNTVEGMKQAKNAKVASEADIKAILRQAKDLTDDNRNMAESIKKQEGRFSVMVNDIKNLVGKVTDGKDNAAANARIRTLRSLIVKSSNTTGRFGTQLSGMNITAVRAALSYVKDSLGAYGAASTGDTKKPEDNAAAA